jgi:hypothetical protein
MLKVHSPAPTRGGWWGYWHIWGKLRLHASKFDHFKGNADGAIWAQADNVLVPRVPTAGGMQTFAASRAEVDCADFSDLHFKTEGGVSAMPLRL